MGTERPANRHISRRRFLKGLACVSAVGALPSCVAYSFIEPRRLKVYRPTVEIPGLPQAFDGLRLAQLTDVHHGPAVGLEYVEQAVELANGLEPDVIALTGDYISVSSAFTAPCMGALGSLRAPLGVHGVLGNHDHWHDPDVTRDEMACAGIIELTNEGRWIERQGQGLYLAGVGDLWEDNQRLEQALERVPHDAAAILLSHNPDYNEHMDDRRVKLMLAGHTHGGQVRLPLVGAPIHPSDYGQKYLAGIVKDGWKQVYVSRGVGVVGPPVRFRCRPEVTLLTLKAA